MGCLNGSRGYDAGRKHARKRHIAVGTLGLLSCVLLTAASAQDRDVPGPLLETRTTIKLAVAIVKRSDDAAAGLEWAMSHGMRHQVNGTPVSSPADRADNA